MKSERFATIISILGVVLTTGSVVASVAQYRAADLQAKAAIVALMPHIEVRALLEKVDSDKYTDRRIEVTSDGGPIYNFEISRLSWIEFRVGRKVAFEQPLIGYYVAEYPTGRTRGLLTTVKGYRNNEMYFQFLRWAQPILGNDVDISEPVTLMRMHYLDALKQENLYYVLVSGGSEIHLSEDAGTSLWTHQSREQKTDFPLDIYALKSESESAEWLNTWKTKIAEARR